MVIYNVVGYLVFLALAWVMQYLEICSLEIGFAVLSIGLGACITLSGLIGQLKFRSSYTYGTTNAIMDAIVYNEKGRSAIEADKKLHDYLIAAVHLGVKILIAVWLHEFFGMSFCKFYMIVELIDIIIPIP